MNILIVGPSGVGKSTLVKMLLSKGFNHTKSYTTRIKRDDEDNDYFFVNEDEFNSYEDFADKSFHLGFQYGIRIRDLTQPTNNILTTNRYGVEKLNKYVNLTIILLPKNKQELFSRIGKLRSDSKNRIELADEEINFYIKNKHLGDIYYICEKEDLNKIAEKISTLKNNL
jgi:guanylate kinase